KMERVIYNLISNAIKFTPEHGTITLQLERQQEQVEIRIVDNGQGISTDQLPHIFDRFYQAESGQQHTEPGSGIGLTLVKELIELHEGKIEVESTVGEGTRFLVQLPLAAGAAEKAEAYTSRLEPLPQPVENKVPAPSYPAPKQILIVEDNPDVRNYLAQEVAGFGYRVSLAADGQVGLQKARNEQPDLIISDVMMPRMDGFQLAEAIRSDVSSSHIPLIMLTAKASDESRIEGLQTGVDAYLTKPFNSQELEVRIKKLIEQRHILKQRFSEAMIIKPEEVSAVPMDQQFLQLVTDTIEAHLGDEQFGVEALAEAAAMSSTHLNRKLKALIGQSAGKLIRSMRLQRAADLLKQQAGTVSEIAYDLGFSDPTNFARAFKKQFGVNPSQYRTYKGEVQ
ncbi:MAG: ATP-binding protein, partial [Bacteroidota bacterium]